MEAKEQFRQAALTNVIEVISNIPESVRRDIYALSFWYDGDVDVARNAAIFVGYNTEQYYQTQITKAPTPAQARWNFAFWPPNEYGTIGGCDNTFLQSWFQSTPWYFSEEENDEADYDDDLTEEILEKSEQLEKLFIEEIISLTQQLFAEGWIEKTFHRNIPILIHETAYYEKPISWTVRANPPGLTDEFVQAFPLT
ncbi:DUF4303 domain-containing protein [Pseudoflavitalea sp. G-6-1-2]|uniref:DUF4303 domain-containing protein n=1 Tax=Pseudoflavitalea sp. G-6-1-2 TaxID=2728841 RepID=UPI00146D1E15|nr:DUF4303 domain-containing protein [Pseudoflavitalea sp. G-6-1-2]NML21909.1 DUF4303 domain-containing protein [Pseudoflavitalea sp. G-6-1-2]